MGMGSGVCGCAVVGRLHDLQRWQVAPPHSVATVVLPPAVRPGRGQQRSVTTTLGISMAASREAANRVGGGVGLSRESGSALAELGERRGTAKGVWVSHFHGAVHFISALRAKKVALVLVEMGRVQKGRHTAVTGTLTAVLMVGPKVGPPVTVVAGGTAASLIGNGVSACGPPGTGKIILNEASTAHTMVTRACHVRNFALKTQSDS
jgi:hypothetical protein